MQIPRLRTGTPSKGVYLQGPKVQIFTVQGVNINNKTMYIIKFY